VFGGMKQGGALYASNPPHQGEREASVPSALFLIE
jgi:hypothetical protein